MEDTSLIDFAAILRPLQTDYLLGGIGPMVVGPSQDIICGYLIVIRQLQQMDHRDCLKTTLITGINGLADSQNFRHILLPQVFIFTQISQSLKIHTAHRLWYLFIRSAITHLPARRLVAKLIGAKKALGGTVSAKPLPYTGK